jgi:hypothetical protein
VGGSLLGLAALWLLRAKGRIAGISGIVDGPLGAWSADSIWRLSFLAGLMASGGVRMATWPEVIVAPAGRSLIAVAIAGALVGYGTRLGGGWSRGHGVWPRALFATLPGGDAHLRGHGLPDRDAPRADWVAVRAAKPGLFWSRNGTSEFSQLSTHRSERSAKSDSAPRRVLRRIRCLQKVANVSCCRRLPVLGLPARLQVLWVWSVRGEAGLRHAVLRLVRNRL